MMISAPSTRARFAKRIGRLRDRMRESGIPVTFMPASANLEYYGGEPRREATPVQLQWPREFVTGLWVSDDEVLLTMPRMAADYEVGNELGWPTLVLEDTEDASNFVLRIGKQLPLSEGPLAVDGHTPASLVMLAREAVPSLEIMSGDSVLLQARMQKDDAEVACLRKAAELTDEAFAGVVSHMRVGMTERDLTAEVDYQLRKVGSRPAYPVAALGWGADYPRSKLERNHLLDDPFTPDTLALFDFGAWFEGYCADFSRVVLFRDPDPEYVTAYAAVVSAQEAVIEALGAPNQTAEGIHAVGMAVLHEAGGLDRYFPDPMGHGIGLELHEPPSLFTDDDTPIEPGMVVAVEPQIFNGPMHVRLEDLVYVKEGTAEKLNAFPSDLVVIS